jgi:hypothetical protein
VHQVGDKNKFYTMMHGQKNIKWSKIVNFEWWLTALFSSCIFPSAILPSDVSTIKLQTVFYSSLCATFLAHPVRHILDQSHIISRRIQIRGSTLCNILQPPATSSRLEPDVCFIIQLSYIPDLTFSLHGFLDTCRTSHS